MSSSRRAPESRRTPDHNLGLDLVRVTEAAALSAARWIGCGDKASGDRAAVDAMRLLLATVPMDGVVVIGEGEKDEAPMLYNGERVGTGEGDAMDIAVDPVEGTNLLAKGAANSIALIAAAPRGTMFAPGPAFYMDKLVVGPESAGKVDLDASVQENLEAIAAARGIALPELTVVALERPRNQAKIDAVRRAGARVRLISDGDVAPALMAALPNTGVDAVIGIGGTPEGVITACALRCLGGEIQGRLAPQSDAERERIEATGLDLGRKLKTADLVSGDDHFFAATGITHGDFLGGVRYLPTGAVTHSLAMRSRSGTVRTIQAQHRWERLTRISAVPYRGPGATRGR